MGNEREIFRRGLNCGASIVVEGASIFLHKLVFQSISLLVQLLLSPLIDFKRISQLPISSPLPPINYFPCLCNIFPPILPPYQSCRHFLIPQHVRVTADPVVIGKLMNTSNSRQSMVLIINHIICCSLHIIHCQRIDLCHHLIQRYHTSDCSN